MFLRELRQTVLDIVDEPLHRHLLLAPLALQALEERVGENPMAQVLDLGGVLLVRRGGDDVGA